MTIKVFGVIFSVKAPAVEFPQVGPMFQIWTHLRESQPRGFDAKITAKTLIVMY